VCGGREENSIEIGYSMEIGLPLTIFAVFFVNLDKLGISEVLDEFWKISTYLLWNIQA
jgi:hypothetical protein